ncbi:alpha/beta hydrolase [Lacticaseibacillus hulanensis]|uniref:alpha/beta hydrolase n=1 Tax=Lacticaseibacillus hulanensis TaxID=2493111 RepID=UPI000FD6E7EA|nr:alpha/beta hydrolase [Lacticaseibacillus hulanensis]
MIQEDIKYGVDALQALDLYTPDEGNGRSLILIHGGGWWQGDKHKEASTATRFASLGYQVTAINYRLAHDGQDIFPTQNEDVTAAYQWLLANVDGFTAENIAFIGGSTGGNLAAYLGLTVGRPFVSLSGLFDLAGFDANHPDVIPVQRKFKVTLSSAAIDQDGSDDPYYKWIIDNLVPNHSAADLERATIFNLVSAQSGPGMLLNSMNEIVPAYEHQHLAKLLREKQVPVETILLPGTRHGEAYIQDVFGSIQQFLNRYMKIKG